MTMPQGQLHVAKALELAQAASEGIGQLGGVDEGWRHDATAGLSGSLAKLNVIADRFFLKTRLALPFARRCEEAARELDGAVAQAGSSATPEGLKAVNAALETYAKAVRALDEQSQMKGMAIT